MNQPSGPATPLRGTDDDVATTRRAVPAVPLRETDTATGRDDPSVSLRGTGLSAADQGGLQQPAGPTRWTDADLLDLARAHAPRGVRPEDMLPVLHGLVAGGADPRLVVASVQAGLAGAQGAVTLPVDTVPAGTGPGAADDRLGVDQASDGSGPAASTGLDRLGGARRPRRLRRALIVVGWLLVWEVADRVVGNRLILTGPVRTCQALVDQAADPDFWVISLASAGRIACGFLAAFLGGIVLALAGHRFRWFHDVLAPAMSVLRTVPMVSFIVMLVIWVGSQALTAWLAFLIVVPLVYTSMATGLASVDRRQREMAQVFRLPAWKRFLYLDRPVFMPFLTSACRVGLGMSWKAGIMAEVFATPSTSIGKEMFRANTFLDTPSLFAWTVVVMLLSLVFERSVMAALRWASRPFGGLLGRGR